MGGRGSSSGARTTKDGRVLPYGSEYHTVLQSDNIKFVVRNDDNTTAPMDTMTKGRIYVTLDYKQEPKFITMYDDNGKRTQQIDLSGKAHWVNGEKLDTPHVHLGYEHYENGTRKPNSEDKALIERVNTIWQQHLGLK